MNLNMTLKNKNVFLVAMRGKGLSHRGNGLSKGCKARVFRVFREWQRLVASAIRGFLNEKHGVVEKAGKKSGLLVKCDLQKMAFPWLDQGLSNFSGHNPH